MRVPQLVGDRVTLRAFQPGDRPVRQRHGWHAEIERCYGAETATGPMTDAEAAEWAEEWERASTEPNRMHWIVDVGGEAAGAAFLYAINRGDRRARYAAGLYDPSLLGRGLGRTATRLVLRHAFEVLNLHRVDLRVLDFNHRAIAAYTACGFVEEGREREVCLLDGQWHDDVVMGVLEQEFRHPEVVSRPDAR